MSSRTWVFGYGSLINPASRRQTDPLVGPARPVVVDGVERGWWVHGVHPGFNATFLGARRRPGRACNGVIFEVDEGGAKEYNGRESQYRLETLEPSSIRSLDGGTIDTTDQYSFYELETLQRPTSQFPVVQSYVDLILSACLDLEQAYPQAAAPSFVDDFITRTVAWSAHWVNDRRYPRRPVAEQPAAMAIDARLRQFKPRQFAAIRIE